MQVTAQFRHRVVDSAGPSEADTPQDTDAPPPPPPPPGRGWAGRGGAGEANDHGIALTIREIDSARW